MTRPFANPFTPAPVSAGREHPVRLAWFVIGQCIVMVALAWLLIGTVTVRASDQHHDAWAGARTVTDDRGARLLAYAEPSPQRFGDAFAAQPWLEAPAHEEAHPLNDAWMGLNAVTADGVIAGYVSDAFVEADGSISELVITPADSRTMPYPVFVSAALVAPGDNAVQLGLTLAQLRLQDSAAAEIAWVGH